jgi:hypothetical protein
MKIAINTCFGAFDLSLEAAKMLNLPVYDGHVDSSCIRRDDKKLIECIEKLGERANGPAARLKIVDVPINVKWHIEEYDGQEHVAENHRIWC